MSKQDELAIILENLANSANLESREAWVEVCISILTWHNSQVTKVLDRIDNANVVEPCMEDCDEVGNAYHKCIYDQYGKVDEAIAEERKRL
jgi:hypothetical protein